MLKQPLKNLSITTLMLFVLLLMASGMILMLISASWGGIRVSWPGIMASLGSFLVGAGIFQVVHFVALRHFSKIELKEGIIDVMDAKFEMLGKIEKLESAGIVDYKTERPFLKEFVDNRSGNIDILTTWIEDVGMLIPILEEYVSRNGGCKIRILMLDSRSPFAIYRSREIGQVENYGSKKIEENLKGMRKSLMFSSNNNVDGPIAEVRLYNERPAFGYWRLSDHLIMSIYTGVENKFHSFEFGRGDVFNTLSSHFDEIWNDKEKTTENPIENILSLPKILRFSYRPRFSDMFENSKHIIDIINNALSLDSAEESVEISWIGTSMDDAWQKILKKTKESVSSKNKKVIFKIAMLDPKWSYLSTMSEVWGRSAKIQYEDIVREVGKCSKNDPVSIELYTHRFVPNYSGCLIDGKTLVLTYVDWEENQLSASDQVYRVYHKQNGDDEKIERYQKWFQFYKENSSSSCLSE